VGVWGGGGGGPFLVVVGGNPQKSLRDTRATADDTRRPVLHTKICFSFPVSFLFLPISRSYTRQLEENRPHARGKKSVYIYAIVL